MCLAPKVRYFNSTTKAPVDLSRLQQMKQFLPPKSKAVKTKPTPSVEKKIEVSLKPKPQDQEPKPTVSIAPRTNHQAALEAVFRDSFGASSTGDVVMFPRIQGSKSLAERPESPPPIKRTLSFSSVSSEMTTPSICNVKHTGTIYLYMDCRYEEETKEEYDYDWDDYKPAALKGLSTPPITHATSLSPPPSPRPRSCLEQEVSFTETLWLPSLP